MIRAKLPTLLAAAFLLLILQPGCGAPPGMPIKNQPVGIPGEATLYERIGGGPAIFAIADNVIERAMRDPRVNFERAGHEHAWSPTPDNMARIKTYWAQYLGMLADGPPVYEGDNLLDVHAGMRISEGEWVAFLDDLRQTLDSFNVPPALQQEFMTRVAGTHDAIVNK